MIVRRERAGRTVRKARLLGRCDEIPGPGDPMVPDRKVPVHDPLPRAVRRGCEAAREDDPLESAPQEVLGPESEHVVERGRTDGQQAEPNEPAEQPLGLEPSLLLTGAEPRAQVRRLSAEASKDRLRLPQLPLVLEPVFVEELALLLHPGRFPRVLRRVVRPSEELRIAHLTPPPSSRRGSPPGSRRRPPGPARRSAPLCRRRPLPRGRSS